MPCLPHHQDDVGDRETFYRNNSAWDWPFHTSRITATLDARRIVKHKNFVYFYLLIVRSTTHSGSCREWKKNSELSFVGEKLDQNRAEKYKQETLTSRFNFSSLSFSSLFIVRSTTYSGSCRVESKKITDITSLEESS